MGRGGLIGCVAALALIAASPAYADTADVTVSDFAFTPGTITITQGDSVTWTFQSPNHTVTSDDTGQSSFDSDQTTTPNHTPPNDKFSWAFPTAGTFTYHCKVHPTMTGTVVVNPKTNNPNPPPPDTTAPKFGKPRVAVSKRRVTFSLNEQAQVSAKLIGPTRKKYSIAGKAGRNVLKLPKRLNAGRYSLSLRGTDAAGNPSKVVRVKFRVR